MTCFKSQSLAVVACVVALFGATGCAAVAEGVGATVEQTGSTSITVEPASLFNAFKRSATPEDSLPKSLAIDAAAFGNDPISRYLTTIGGVEFYLTTVGQSICLQYGSGPDSKHFDGGTGCTNISEVVAEPLLLVDGNTKIAAVVLPIGCTFTSNGGKAQITPDLAVIAGTEKLSGSYICREASVSAEVAMTANQPPASTGTR